MQLARCFAGQLAERTVTISVVFARCAGSSLRMAQSASPFAASPSHLPLAAQRQLELELAALRRAVARAFTSLDVGRRKWAAQSESGKRSLSACLNGLTQLAYAEGTHWGALAECTEMRRLVAVRALHKLRAAQAEVDSTLEVRTP